MRWVIGSPLDDGAVAAATTRSTILGSMYGLFWKGRVERLCDDIQMSKMQTAEQKNHRLYNAK